MPDPNNPFSYMSPDQLALLEEGDVAALPPAVAQQLLQQRLKADALRSRAAAPAAQGPDTFDNFAFLASLTPERRAQNAEMGTLDERGQILEEQLALAQGLQSRPTAQRGTLGGTIGSGLGGIVDAIRGGLQERDLRAQQQALLRRKDEGRRAYQDDLSRFTLQQKQRVAPGMGAADVPLLPPGMG